MVIDLESIPDATPLDGDEISALIPRHIQTQAQLNEWEQLNILKGEEWVRRRRKRDLLDEKFIRDLHREMFGETWKWAGDFRKSNKNIGIDWQQIAVQLRNLLEDTRYQIANKTYLADETAIRFHHRLVWIHPFSNGNGRHARLIADLLIQQLGNKRFSWGSETLIAGDARRNYIDALRAADQRNYELLIKFSRS